MLPGSLVDQDTYTMLAQGNTGDPSPARALAGKPLKLPSAFIEADAAPAVRQASALQWLLPVLRVTMALTWIASGIVSIWFYPREASHALLERAGLTDLPATIALYGGAGVDLALGLASLVLRERRPVWALQAAVIIVYTAIITVALPEQWAHPFGPVLKNLVLLAVLVMLCQLDRPAGQADR
jgi:hypothetical protein